MEAIFIYGTDLFCFYQYECKWVGMEPKVEWVMTKWNWVKKNSGSLRTVLSKARSHATSYDGKRRVKGVEESALAPYEWEWVKKNETEGWVQREGTDLRMSDNGVQKETNGNED